MEQFEIFPIFKLSLILPNTVAYLIIAGLLSLAIATIGTGGKTNSTRSKIVPSTFAITHESLFRSLL